MTGKGQNLSDKPKNLPVNDRWPAVISCLGIYREYLAFTLDDVKWSLRFMKDVNDLFYDPTGSYRQRPS